MPFPVEPVGLPLAPTSMSSTFSTCDRAEKALSWKLKATCLGADVPSAEGRARVMKPAGDVGGVVIVKGLAVEYTPKGELDASDSRIVHRLRGDSQGGM